MKKILILTLICCTVICAGCAGSKKSANSTALLMQYMQDESQTNLVNLSKSYGNELSRTMKERKPNPGDCAEYAVTLAKLHHDAEANTWFNLESQYYPGSEKLVEQLKLDLIPQYASDTSTNAMEADLSNIATEDKTAVSTDNGQKATKVKMTKKEKKKLARQKKHAKHEALHDKKKAQKAKLRAKKQAKRNAAKLKKQQQKERAQQKKQKQE